MATKLRHTIQLPAPGASDVGSREFSLKVDGNSQPTQTLAKEALEVQFDVDAGASVECWLVDIDTSNNRSPESEHLTFTAADTFAPPAPGALGVKNVEQVEV